MSKKSTQARRVRTYRLSNLLVGGFLVIILLFSVLFTVHQGLVYTCTNSNELYEYNGHFELSKIRKTRNTTYQFILDNGDIITANPDIMQHNQRIEEFTELHFLYTENQNIISSTYTAVEITTLEGATSFLSTHATTAEAKQGVVLGSIFAVLILVVNIIYWLCLVSVKPRKKRK